MGSHDSKWVGHLGIHNTLALVGDAYYWPYLRDDVKAYVKTCLIFEQDKIEQGAPARLLKPLPILERPWESVSMDFMVGLPTSEWCNWALVVVDRYSKYATFILAPKECSTEQAAHLFFKHVVKYWGLPRPIVTNWDIHFTGRFWTELFKLMGSNLNFSINFHSQSNGQNQCSLGTILETLCECQLGLSRTEYPVQFAEPGPICQTQSRSRRVQNFWNRFQDFWTWFRNRPGPVPKSDTQSNC